MMSGLLIACAAAAAQSSSPAPAPFPATQPSVDGTSTAASASYLREADYRVARIGYRIGLSGARYCPDPYPLTGLLLHHLAEYGAADRTAAAKLYSLDRGPGILAVIEGSPGPAERRVGKGG